MQDRPNAREHPCIQRNREQWALMAAGDWDAVAQMLAPDAVDDDRRVGIQTLFEGRDAIVENLRAAYDVGARLWSIDQIETRGGELALLRFIVGGPERESAFVAEMLVILFVGRAGPPRRRRSSSTQRTSRQLCSNSTRSTRRGRGHQTEIPTGRRANASTSWRARTHLALAGHHQ